MVLRSPRARDAEHETGRGKDAVIGAEHRGAQPTYAFGPVALAVPHARYLWLSALLTSRDVMSTIWIMRS